MLQLVARWNRAASEERCCRLFFDPRYVQPEIIWISGKLEFPGQLFLLINCLVFLSLEFMSAWNCFAPGSMRSSEHWWWQRAKWRARFLGFALVGWVAATSCFLSVQEPTITNYIRAVSITYVLHWMLLVRLLCFAFVKHYDLGDWPNPATSCGPATASARPGVISFQHRVLCSV